MIRQVFLLGAVVLIAMVALSVRAEEESNTQDLKTVVVESDFKGDVTDAGKLPDGFREVAERLDLKGATFHVEGDKLRVGVQVADIRPGVELERLDLKSDCPDNSQFGILTLLKDRDEALRDMTAAWTRFRHRSPDAQLRRINIYSTADNKRNFDVQLDIRKTAQAPLRE